MPFSPTPNDTTFGQSNPIEAPKPSPDADPGDTGLPDAQQPGSGQAEQETESAPPVTEPGRPLGPTVAGIAGLVVAGLALLVLALRRLRTYRHLRRGAPGAWAELLDALALAGVPADRAQPATDVADATDQRFGTHGARRVADLAERTVFGPPAGSQAPEGVRSALQEVRRATRGSVPVWRRWWWWVDPRVLGR